MTSFAGQCFVDDIKLYSSNDQPYDLRYIYSSIELYEDIYSQFMSGSIVVSDQQDLISTIPILGQEKLYLKFHTTDMADEYIEGWFYVYKISNLIVEPHAKRLTYTLNFVSGDAINDLNQRVSKSMRGRVDELVYGVFKDYLKPQKVFALEEAVNTIKVIPAYWSPSEIISYLKERAISQNNSKTFVSFESNKRYNFSSVEMLVNSPEFSEYNFSRNTRQKIGDNSIKNTEEEFKMILNVSVDTVSDYLSINDSGGMSGKLLTHNILTKTIKTVDYDLLRDWDKTQHLNPYPNFGASLRRNRRAQINHKTNIHYTYDSQVSDYFQTIMLERRALMNQLNSSILDIEVYGRTDIEVGRTIYLNFPLFAPVHENENNRDLVSDYYSGKYLITAIAHRVDGLGRHLMNMQCVKDSFRKAL